MDCLFSRFTHMKPNAPMGEKKECSVLELAMELFHIIGRKTIIRKQ